MVNIVAAIPPAITAAFQAPTEGLYRDNLLKPIIPKTEIIASYKKLRDDEARDPFFSQSRNVIQNENEFKEPTFEQQLHSSATQQRLYFFSKSGLSETEHESKALEIIKDVNLTMLVIQEKYNNAVTPLLEASVDHLL